MNRTLCPQCGYYVQAEWYKEPGGTEFALCPNHGTNIVECEIVIRKPRSDGE